MTFISPAKRRAPKKISQYASTGSNLTKTGKNMAQSVLAKLITLWHAT